MIRCQRSSSRSFPLRTLLFVAIDDDDDNDDNDDNDDDDDDDDDNGVALIDVTGVAAAIVGAVEVVSAAASSDMDALGVLMLTSISARFDGDQGDLPSLTITLPVRLIGTTPPTPPLPLLPPAPPPCIACCRV